ncbi:MAG: ligand-gated channel protein [Gammaproteobacteria bacterium RIFCSPLOWO2_02_FULL_57_10]|nr:MAG: ligand-gated channel protein [Gammaproteobacteria bacterium RIFCSPLOWO2_02_FULL_57_10]
MKKLTLACAISSLTGTVLAQTPVLEEMLVTGSRTPERLDEVTASVSILDLDALRQDLGINAELQNILAFRVPGMAPSTNSSSNFGQTLRGRTTLVMIDGVPQSTPLRNGALDIRSIDAAALQRVEVVKGATSVYGNGAAGGIINYITRDAGEEALRGELQQNLRFSAIKSDDSIGHRVSGTVDGTLERLSYVVNATLDEHGVQRDADGDIIGLSLYGLSDVRSRNLFGKVAYALGDDRRVSLMYTWYDSEQSSDLVDVVSSVNDGTKTYAVKAASGTVIPGEPQGVDDNSNIVLQYRDDTLTSNTSLTVDAYTQDINNVFFYSTSFADPTAGFQGGNSVIVSDKQGMRVNLESAFDWNGVDTSFIYGLDLLEDVTSQPLADGRSWVPDMDMQNRAAYVQGKWVAGEWVFKGGVRRESVDIDVPNYVTLRMCNARGTCVGGNPVLGGTLSYTDTTWNAGIRYNGNAAFSPFISYSQGFDVSDLGLLLRAASVPNLTQVQTEASLIDHYEVGASGQLGRWNYEVAVYQSESELGTATVENPPGSGLYTPVRAPQDIHGYEVALGFAPSEAVDLGLTWTYVEGKDPGTDIYLDARKIAPPKLTAWADWQVSERWRIGVQYLQVMDRDRFDAVNGRYSGAEGPVESYQILNMSAGWQAGNWQASLGVENLLNEDYFPARAQAFTYAGYNTMGLGRTVNLGLNYRF